MFLNDKRDGFGRLIWSDGAYYEGFWQADKRCGQGCFYHSNGNKNEGVWKDGKLQSEEESFMSMSVGDEKRSLLTPASDSEFSYKPRKFVNKSIKGIGDK
jgi:hypothetical protein